MIRRIAAQLISLILPATVLVVVPWVIEPNWTLAPLIPLTVGLLVILCGVYIMAQTIADFIRIGRGTLAPWDPPTRLLTGGMYAHVRNPMILGVLTVLLGEAAAILSWRLLAWAAAFFAINTIYFVLSEEPGLGERFGAEYRDYKKNVPRWIPRLRPYRAGRRAARNDDQAASKQSQLPR